MTSPSNSGALDEPRQLRRLADLAAEPERPVGTRVRIEEDGFVYTSVGNTRPEIAARLNWTQPNVWLPDHALKRIRSKHPVINDPVLAGAALLRNPTSVHSNSVELN